MIEWFLGLNQEKKFIILIMLRCLFILIIIGYAKWSNRLDNIEGIESLLIPFFGDLTVIAGLGLVIYDILRTGCIEHIIVEKKIAYSRQNFDGIKRICVVCKEEV